MILVVGNVVAREGRLAEALVLSLAHVKRSRLEAGCISHAVHVDTENAQRLVFVEQWSDRAALRRHFDVAESKAFVQALSALADAAPGITIYEANPPRSV